MSSREPIANAKPIDSSYFQCQVCKAWVPPYSIHYCSGPKTAA